MGTPAFVVGWEEVWVVEELHLHLVSEVGSSRGTELLNCGVCADSGS